MLANVIQCKTALARFSIAKIHAFDILVELYGNSMCLPYGTRFNAKPR